MERGITHTHASIGRDRETPMTDGRRGRQSETLTHIRTRGRSERKAGNQGKTGSQK